MSEKKITGLDPASAFNLTDLIEKVNDPSGTHVSQKATGQQVVDLVVAQVAAGVKVYRALLNQSGTNPPVPVVLENTVGAVVWSYEDVGSYKANLVGAFTTNKTFVMINSTRTADFDGFIAIAYWADANSIQVYVANNDLDPTDAGNRVDNNLFLTSLEIRVYP